MKKAWYFLRKYYREILTSSFAIISTIVAFVFRDMPFSVWISISVILVSMIILIYLRNKDKAFYFLPLSNRDEIDDWIGWGNFSYDRNKKSFLITNSLYGYIFSKCLDWSNYRLEFEFKIVKSCVGVVLRSLNLFNYIMLQMSEKGINPHICIMGGWKPWKHEDVGLTFEKTLSFDRWYKCLITVDKGNIKIIIKESGVIVFDREWNIPVGAIMTVYYENAPGDDVAQKSMNYPVNLEYGTFGFRNAGNEKALIKNILVEKL